MIVLSQAQLEQYETEGHLTVEGVFTLAEIDELRDRVDGLIDGRYDATGILAGQASNRSDADPGRQIKQVMPRVHPIPDPVLRKYSQHPGLKALVCQLLNIPSADVFQQQALIKDPGYSNGTPWHQDNFYWKLEGPAVTAWFPLEPVSAANGTMSLFPRTHKGEVYRHDRAAGGSDFHTLQAGLDESQAVPLAIPLGSVSFHHKALIHGAFANQGAIRRIAMAQHYFYDGHPVDGPYIRNARSKSANRQ